MIKKMTLEDQTITATDTRDQPESAHSTERRFRMAPSRRALGVIAAFVVMALGAAAVVPAPAGAASTAPGDFSSYIANNPAPRTVDNCSVQLGIVVDWTPSPGYHHVGGVRVNCTSVHSVIAATVALFYWTGTRWLQYGNSSYFAEYGRSGYGTAILYTPVYCVGSLRTASWMVAATVQTERTGATVYSNVSQTSNGTGC